MRFKMIPRKRTHSCSLLCTSSFVGVAFLKRFPSRLPNTHLVLARSQLLYINLKASQPPGKEGVSPSVTDEEIRPRGWKETRARRADLELRLGPEGQSPCAPLRSGTRELQDPGLL